MYPFIELVIIMDFPPILCIYIFDAFNTPVFIRDRTKNFILQNCIFFAKGLN